MPGVHDVPCPHPENDPSGPKAPAASGALPPASDAGLGGAPIEPLLDPLDGAPDEPPGVLPGDPLDEGGVDPPLAEPLDVPLEGAAELPLEPDAVPFPDDGVCVELPVVP